MQHQGEGTGRDECVRLGVLYEAGQRDADVRGVTTASARPCQKTSNYTYYRSTIDPALTTSCDEFLNAFAQ